MRTRTRTDSTAGQRLDLSWDSTPLQDTQEDNPEPVDATDDNASAVDIPVNPVSADKQEDVSSTFDKDVSLSAPEQNLDTPPQEQVQSIQQPEPDKEQVQSIQQPDQDIPHQEQVQDIQPRNELQDNSDNADNTSSTDNTEAKQDGVSEADKSAEQPKRQENKSRGRGVRNQQPPASILVDNSSLGSRLLKYREEACVKQEDLAQKLFVQVSVIKDLENGDYESLSRAYGDNSVFVVATLKDICRELGISKNTIEELEDLCYKEIINSGHFTQDAKSQRIVDRTQDGQKNSFNVNSSEPIIKKLPQILIVTLVIVLVIFFFISVVMPYIKHTRKEPEKKYDFAPLVMPEKSAPMQLQIP